MEDIFTDYLEYTRDTEPPRLFHRWSLLVSIGALLGRNVYVQHGHSRIYPNLYCMFVGESGTRKSSAIKMVRKLISAAGYDKFAAEKTSKEKFLIDLSGQIDPGLGYNNGKQRSDKSRDAERTFENLFGDDFDKTPREVFIVADEFNEFAGSSNHELHTTLGNLWDWDDENLPFSNSFKSGSVQIWQPTVSILSGNTQEGFSRAFPPDTVGQGFLSRMLLIHGAKSGRRIAFPTIPTEDDTGRIVTTLMRIRSKNAFGQLVFDEDATRLLTGIYESWSDLPDIRLVSYSTRRFTQLLKLSIIIACARFERDISADTVVAANTILSAAEYNMPRALGEFGKAKNSDVTNKIIGFLEKALRPQSIQDIWKAMGVNNLASPKELGELLQGLRMAEKIQWINIPNGVQGFMPKRVVNGSNPFVDWDLLTEEERSYIR